MTNYRQDDVGYCINVTPLNVNVLKILKSSEVFTIEQAKSHFIKSMIAFSSDKDDFYLDAVCGKFSDKKIDIFVHDEGLIKGYPLVARTRQGIPLHGNLAILANHHGYSILLTKQQVNIALKELEFIKDLPIIDVDLSTSEPENLSKYPESVKTLIDKLADYCVANNDQIVCKAILASNTDVAALVLCLQGDRQLIDVLYEDITKFLKDKYT